MKKRISSKIMLLLLIQLLFSCTNEPDYHAAAEGLWRLKEVNVDGVPMDRTQNPEVRLLIERSGLYRNHNGNGLSTFGTWHITDNQWIEFTADSWRMMDAIQENAAGAWMNIHVPFRFTILTLTPHEMSIRMKCFSNEVKYSSVFDIVPLSPQVAEGDKEAIDRIFMEFRTLKTYVFIFTKI